MNQRQVESQGAGDPGVAGTSVLLEAVDVAVHFAGVKAVDGVSVEVRQGEILGLIGPNGAGKTTLINVLSGFQRPDRGTVSLTGVDITGWSPDRRARAGLGRTFQNIRPFRLMSVAANVEAGALGAGLSRVDAAEKVVEILDLLDLGDVAGRPAGVLPQGDERRLGIARALAMTPSVLLLDEPAAGLNEFEGDRLLDVLRAVRTQLGCSLLVIEHDMRLVMRLCERLQVLDHGRTIAIGAPPQIQADPAVIDAYLGVGHGLSERR